MFIIISFFRKRTCFSFSFIVIFCIVVTESKNITCRQPPTTSRMRINPVKEEYDVGEKITFTCNEGYVLMNGASENTCNSNGEWTEELPSCSRNLAYQRMVDYTGLEIVTETNNETSHQDIGSLLVDQNKETCLSLSTNGESKTRIHLDNEYNISSVEITAKIEKSRGRFIGKVIILRDNSTHDNHEEKSFIITEHSGLIPVDFENGRLGSIVEVTLPKHRKLNICEIQIFSIHGSSIECNDPVEISNCKVQIFWKNGTQVAEYKHTNGSPIKDVVIKCIEGNWEKKEVTCKSEAELKSEGRDGNSSINFNSTESSVNTESSIDLSNEYSPKNISLIVCILLAIVFLVIVIICIVLIRRKRRKTQSSLYSTVNKEPSSNATTSDPLYEVKNDEYVEYDPKSRTSRNSKCSDGPIYSEISRRPDSELA